MGFQIVMVYFFERHFFLHSAYFTINMIICCLIFISLFKANEKREKIDRMNDNILVSLWR